MEVTFSAPKRSLMSPNEVTWIAFIFLDHLHPNRSRLDPSTLRCAPAVLLFIGCCGHSKTAKTPSFFEISKCSNFYELLQNENHPNQFGCSFSLLNNFMCKKNMACFRMERGEWHRHRTSECLNISDTKTQLMRLQQVRSPNSKASSERRSKLLYDVVWTCGIHILHSKRQYLEHEYNHRIQEIFNRTHWTDP